MSDGELGIFLELIRMPPDQVAVVRKAMKRA
jgi:hypothetical protein